MYVYKRTLVASEEYLLDLHMQGNLTSTRIAILASELARFSYWHQDSSFIYFELYSFGAFHPLLP